MFHKRKLIIGILGLTSIISGCVNSSDKKQEFISSKNQTFSEKCTVFNTTLPYGAKITEKKIRSKDPTLPDFLNDVCIVRGELYVSPDSTIHWSVELPMQNQWNGKTITVGGGGFDGFISTDRRFYHELLGPNANNYVKMSSDSGHQTTNFYPWAMNESALVNHAYLANHQFLNVGTYLTKAFYGKAPTKRYMFGQSNGGRSGIVSAELYPEDYDGIVAIAPAIGQQAHETGNSSLFRHIYADRSNWLSESDIKLYSDAEMKACDGLDGLEDGIISNYKACKFEAKTLQCDGEKTDKCLTSGQIETIGLINSHKPGLQLADGLSSGYPAYGRGGASTGDWKLYMFGTDFKSRNGSNYFLGENAAKVVEKNENASVMTHDYNYYVSSWNRLSSLIDPVKIDISNFSDKGGKLLIFYPSGDTCVSIFRAEEWFNTLKKKSTKNLHDTIRFFDLPSLGHDLVGSGANSIDYITIIDNWVDKSQAPNNLIAEKYDDGNTDNPVFWGEKSKLSRPICENGTYAKYDGKGNPNDHNSFKCVI